MLHPDSENRENKGKTLEVDMNVYSSWMSEHDGN